MLDTDTKQCIRITGDASRSTSVGWDASLDVIRRLLQTGLESLHTKQDDLTAVSACLSGIDLPEQSLRMEQSLGAYFPNARMEVVNDSFAVLSAGTLGESGVALIAGTGTIAIGENRAGGSVRAGGYGNLIGDEGSGFDVGRAGIMKAIQSYEERGPMTELWSRAVVRYGIQKPDDFIPIIYESSYPVGQIAAFAEDVFDMADQDDVARSIVLHAVQEYAGLVHSVCRRLPDIEPTVVLAGGIFQNQSGVVRRMVDALPELTIRRLDTPASVGALMRALRSGVEPSTTGQPNGSLGDLSSEWGPIILKTR